MLVGVVEGLERQQGGGLCIATALEGMGDQPVGELGVLGQRRAMQVRADDALVDQALKAIVAVVAGARDDGRSERRGIGVQKRAAAMVLESHKGLRCQVGFDGYVADQAVGAAYGFGGNDPQTLNAILAHIVRTAEQLIAATDGEQRAAILNIGCDLVFLGEQLVCHG